MKALDIETSAFYADDNIYYIKDDEIMTNNKNVEPWMQELWDWADKLQISNEVIPRETADLKQLTELKLENLDADAYELIQLISKLPNLKTLDLSGYGGESLPEEIVKITSLEQLILKYSSLEKLPNKIYELKNLSVLNLTENYSLDSLPEGISRLECLKSMDLSGCYDIQSLPGDFFQLTQLEELQLYSTELYSDEIGSLKKLKKLSLSGDLYELPVWTFDLKELTELVLNEVALSEIPSEIGELTKLEYLDLGFNESVTELPDSFGNLTNLKHLLLTCCSLQSLPESFINLTQLEKLDLGPSDMNTLEYLSPEVSKFLTQLGDVVTGWEPNTDEQHNTKADDHQGEVPDDIKDYIDLDDIDSNALIQQVIDTLDKIITDNINHFREEGDFKVRPGYGYDKFYLDWVDGSYGMSLQSLIHYIMYEDGIYKKILNKNQYARLIHVVNEQPESIFGADESIDENYSQLQYDFLDYFYYTPIKFVYDKLTSLGFDVSDAFCEYLGIDPDDDDYDEDYDDYESEADEDYEAETDDYSSDIASHDSVEITEPAMVIRISQTYREDMTPQELYDITRSAWKVNLDRANTIDYAFAVYKGEIKEIYKVAGWHEAGTTFVPKRDDIIGSGRFEFVGTVAEDAIRDKYLNKSVKHIFKKGAVIPTMYVNC